MKTNISSTIAEIESFRNLKENWDGYGAIVIPEETIKLTKKFLLSIPEEILNQLPTPYVAPSSHGTIVIEWDWWNAYPQDNCFIEFEIGYIRSGYFTVFPDGYEPYDDNICDLCYNNKIENLLINLIKWKK